MVYKYSISILVLILFCFSCTDKTSEDDSSSDIIIKTGTVCGWCTLNDTLTISGKNLRYVNYTNCSTTKASVEKSGKLSNSDFDALLKLLDFEELKKLELNSCNVCADGCDEWLFYKNGLQTHYLRFGTNDPKLQSIRAFLDRLNAIKTQYSSAK
jgi:hypothetical protein